MRSPYIVNLYRLGATLRRLGKLQLSCEVVVFWGALYL